MQLSKANALLEYQGTFGSIGRPARMSGLMDASVNCVTRRHVDRLNRSVPCIARWIPSTWRSISQHTDRTRPAPPLIDRPTTLPTPPFTYHRRPPPPSGAGPECPPAGPQPPASGARWGEPALHTPSRLEVMAGIGCHRLPDTLGGALDQFHASLFSAVFNRASSMVSVACQDGKISLFDTEQLLFRAAAPPTAAAASSDRGPPRPALRPVKEIQCQDVGWSIIGSAFAPDGKWIAYSSWSRYLHLANTWGEHCLHEPYLVSQSRSRHFCSSRSPSAGRYARRRGRQ